MSWSRMDDHWWMDAAARLPRPFARTDALMDLRVHAGQVLRYHQTGGREGRPRIPSRRELAERWGWSEKQARGLVEGGEWRDPHLEYPPLFGATSTPEGPNVEANHPETQKPRASKQETRGQARLEVSPSTPADDTAPAPPIEGADLAHLQGLQIAPGVSRSAIGPAQAGFWRTLTGPGAPFPAKKVTRDRLKGMNLILRRFGADALPTLARFATSDHPTARFLRGTGNPDALLRNAERYLEEAAALPAPTRPAAIWEAPNPDPIEDTSTPNAARCWATWKQGTLQEAIHRIRDAGGKMPELRAWLALRVSHPEEVIAYLHTHPTEKKAIPPRVPESPRVQMERRIL